MNSTLLISWSKSNIAWFVNEYTKKSIKADPMFLQKVRLSLIKTNDIQNSIDGWLWEILKYSTLHDTEWEKIGNISSRETRRGS